ncbi:hypothetical protein [Hymenobacter metallilatus]|uniref:Uncharacterized protein n=1 Tax=Hymenobacter metallilatus TaxID=2493666 RepID=A0A3R9MC18_9BACT|nr:hypothetical protein [Hymenobacter metallilatus]RSK36286.1 hypothetical protein EI290_05240 [Hymenobacter metallilatus]
MLQKLAPVLFVLACAAFVLLPKIIASDSQEPVHETEVRVPLTNLSWGDTIQLQAFYADCGEFGGHLERIKVFLPESSPEGPPVAVLLLDSTNCEIDPKQHLLFMAQQVNLSVSQQYNVEEYMRELLVYGQQKFPSVNASNGFSASLYSQEMGVKMVDIRVSDTRFTFDGFSRLRQSLFIKSLPRHK